jgi:gamma-glutamyl-gamma-aminobutyrate hydrolase PuuD
VALPLVLVPGYQLRRGRVSGWEDRAAALPASYAAALRRAGVQPVVLAAPDPGPASELLGPFAGVVLVGGGDVDPARYGAVTAPEVYGVEADRDAVETDLARTAVQRGIPLFAICRGAQVLNVAFGGTLVQHLAAVPGTLPHGRPAVGAAGARHHVGVEPGSRLAAALHGASALAGCVSIHHQAADRIGAGLLVTARSDDGVVEALETSTPGWVLAVQWHPERTAAVDRSQQALFDAFAGAVRDRERALLAAPTPPGDRAGGRRSRPE